ncbi:hypothetical protein ACJX0J_000497 [Zea mays]
MDSYKDGILPNGIREFLLLSFFLSIEETGTIQFNIFWNLVYRWMNCIADIDPKKKPWEGIYRILIVNFYTELENYIFHNKSLDSELGTHVPSDESIFLFFFTLLYLTLSCFLNLSFGFLVF